MKIQAEIVNGKCPTCEEYTMLVGITKQFFRCMTCGADLEQHINGKISYIPHLHKHTLLVGISREFFRCMSCGADLEQHVNGKISYIPTMHPNTLKSDLEKYFSDGES